MLALNDMNPSDALLDLDNELRQFSESIDALDSELIGDFRGKCVLNKVFQVT